MVITLDHCSEKLPIQYDTETKEIIYKENHVLFSKIKEAYDNEYDTYQIAPKLIYRKRSGICYFGCLVLTEEKVQLLINRLWKLSNQ